MTNMNMPVMLSTIFLSALGLIGCGSSNSAQSASQSAVSATDSSPSAVTGEPIECAPFNSDSCMAFVEKQCSFGPRVPGTEAHEKCAKWLQGCLEQWCDDVVAQKATVTTFDGKKLAITNLVGSFKPEAERRVLLLAHWDCRPWADADPDESKRGQPVMGANDAASGTAVLLEIARVIKNENFKPDVGVDLLFTDAEDWGDSSSEDNPDSWALGTQYWATHPHKAGYKADFAILLDMVGASGAQFMQEINSMQAAPEIVQKVWKVAQQSGYGGFFLNQPGGMVTDDHLYVNRAGIRCIDIIDTRTASSNGFFAQWHTTADTPDKLSTQTLHAVGQTLVNVIYTH